VVGLTVAKLYVHCRQAACGHRNDRTGGRRNCEACGHPLPKRRVAKHAETLRDDSYAAYVEIARLIHGVTDESCCACGKPRSQERRCDRDHEHNRRSPFFGQPRGLLCGGNQGCNVLILPWITAAVARGIHLAKLEGLEPDAERWRMIADYLERVESHYAKESASDVA
jgi:hypothetical protein